MVGRMSRRARSLRMSKRGGRKIRRVSKRGGQRISRMSKRIIKKGGQRMSKRMKVSRKRLLKKERRIVAVQSKRNRMVQAMVRKKLRGGSEKSCKIIKNEKEATDKLEQIKNESGQEAYYYITISRSNSGYKLVIIVFDNGQYSLKYNIKVTLNTTHNVEQKYFAQVYKKDGPKFNIKGEGKNRDLAVHDLYNKLNNMKINDTNQLMHKTADRTKVFKDLTLKSICIDTSYDMAEPRRRRAPNDQQSSSQPAADVDSHEETYAFSQDNLVLDDTKTFKFNDDESKGAFKINTTSTKIYIYKGNGTYDNFDIDTYLSQYTKTKFRNLWGIANYLVRLPYSMLHVSNFPIVYLKPTHKQSNSGVRTQDSTNNLYSRLGETSHSMGYTLDKLECKPKGIDSQLFNVESMFFPKKR